MDSSTESIKLAFEKPEPSRYRLNYEVEIRLNGPVRNHAWSIRLGLPQESFLRVEQFSRYIEPECAYATAKDYLGQEYVFGLRREEHERWRYGFHAELLQHAAYERAPDAVPLQVFLRSDPMTAVPVQDVAWLHEFRGPKRPVQVLEWCIGVMHEIYENLSFVSGVTDFRTPAADAARQGSGVCQDFSHILIGLCRMHGIAARYVNGFLVGEGVSHAWVEVFDDDRWYGLDPTHDRLVVHDYVPVARGRNAADCSLNRGVWASVVEQALSISATLVAAEGDAPSADPVSRLAAEQ